MPILTTTIQQRSFDNSWALGPCEVPAGIITDLQVTCNYYTSVSLFIRPGDSLNSVFIELTAEDGGSLASGTVATCGVPVSLNAAAGCTANVLLGYIPAADDWDAAGYRATVSPQYVSILSLSPVGSTRLKVTNDGDTLMDEVLSRDMFMSVEPPLSLSVDDQGRGLISLSIDELPLIVKSAAADSEKKIYTINHIAPDNDGVITICVTGEFGDAVHCVKGPEGTDTIFIDSASPIVERILRPMDIIDHTIMDSLRRTLPYYPLDDAYAVLDPATGEYNLSSPLKRDVDNNLSTVCTVISTDGAYNPRWPADIRVEVYDAAK